MSPKQAVAKLRKERNRDIKVQRHDAWCPEPLITRREARRMLRAARRVRASRTKRRQLRLEADGCWCHWGAWLAAGERCAYEPGECMEIPF